MVMTRIRTGIARRPDGPEDANPMNRRLPAEVVSRRKGENRAHHGKAVKEEVAPSHLSTDLKQVLAMKPEARSKWLAKAVQQAHPQDGRLSPKSIYEIIAHAKFAKDLGEKAGQRMYRVLHANLSLFSTKQQKFLEKECALAKQFATAAFAPAPGAEEEDTTAADAMEDMMARCRAFVRERQSERGERNLEGEEGEADAVPQVDAKQATQDEAAELKEANAEPPPEQLISQAEPQKEAEADSHLTRASKSRSRSRSSPSKTKVQEATGSPDDAKEEASLKKASKPESKENGKGKSDKEKDEKQSKSTKESTNDTKDVKAKKPDEKAKGTKGSKEKAKDGRRRENHKRRSSSSQSDRGRARNESESSRSRRRSDKRRGKRSRNSSDSSYVSRKRGHSSSSRPKRRR